MNYLTTYKYRQYCYLHAYKASNKAHIYTFCACDLCACVLSTYVLYNCRAISTNVMISLQIRPFLTNKANFKKVKFYVTKEMEKDYEKKDTWSIGKNKANSKPNKANSNPIEANLQNEQMTVSAIITKEYQKTSTWAIYPKQTQFKPNLSRPIKCIPGFSATDSWPAIAPRHRRSSFPARLFPSNPDPAAPSRPWQYYRPGERG